MALSGVERQQTHRVKREESGYKMLYGLYTPDNKKLRKKIRKAAEKLIKQHNRKRGME